MIITHVAPARKDPYLIAISKTRAIWRTDEAGKDCTFHLCDREGKILKTHVGYFFELETLEDFAPIMRARI